MSRSTWPHPWRGPSRAGPAAVTLGCPCLGRSTSWNHLGLFPGETKHSTENCAEGVTDVELSIMDGEAERNFLRLSVIKNKVQF